jgi:methionyl-tRNA formyltransferase
LFLAKKDRAWEQEKLQQLYETYPQMPDDIPILRTHSPNSKEAEDFIKDANPDIMIARCKVLLKKSIFSLPTIGTFSLHPGICPEYRNSHGCFWALANNDAAKVGMTLLKIDEGVDTGPVYGYYTYDFDEINESHIVIQSRVVFDNLQELSKKLIEIYAGDAVPIDTTGRMSGTWGQPWLTVYLTSNFNRRRREALMTKSSPVERSHRSQPSISSQVPFGEF